MDDPDLWRLTPEQIEKATDHFSSTNLIGSGGFGTVFKGLLFGTRVAIKRLNVSTMDVEGEEERMWGEVSMLARLRHPNIVLLIGACAERMCIVTEFMSGGSLQDRLSKSKLVPCPSLLWVDRFRIASEMSAGLLHMHLRKILHRDMKPENVLLNKHNLCKLADVGLAKLYENNKSTLVSDIRGTFGYIDPHQQETGQLTKQSDVYALGLVLLQLMTGLTDIAEVHELLASCEMRKEKQNSTESLKALLARMADSSDYIEEVSKAFRDVIEFSSSSRFQQGIEKASEKILERLDTLAGDWPIEKAAIIVRLALQCVERSRELRPDLEEKVVPVLFFLTQQTDRLYEEREREREREGVRRREEEEEQKKVIIQQKLTTVGVNSSTGGTDVTDDYATNRLGGRDEAYNYAVELRENSIIFGKKIAKDLENLKPTENQEPKDSDETKYSDDVSQSSVPQSSSPPKKSTDEIPSPVLSPESSPKSRQGELIMALQFARKWGWLYRSRRSGLSYFWDKQYITLYSNPYRVSCFKGLPMVAGNEVPEKEFLLTPSSHVVEKATAMHGGKKLFCISLHGKVHWPLVLGSESEDDIYSWFKYIQQSIASEEKAHAKQALGGNRSSKVSSRPVCVHTIELSLLAQEELSENPNPNPKGESKESKEEFPASSLVSSKDGLLWASCGNTINGCRGEELVASSFESGDKGVITSLCVSRDGFIWSGSENGYITKWVWDEESLNLEKIASSFVSEEISVLLSSPDGIVWSGHGACIESWTHDVKKKKTNCDSVNVFRVHTGKIEALALGTGDLVWSGSRDGTIKSWRSGRGCVTSIDAKMGHVIALAKDVDNILWSTGRDGMIKGWKDATCQIVIESHSDILPRAMVVGNEGEVWSGHVDGSIRAWKEGKCVFTLLEHDDEVIALHVGEDGTLWSSSADMTIKGWLKMLK